MASNLYNSGLFAILSGSINYLNDTIGLALVNTSYTYSVSHTSLSDITSSEASGVGYTRKVLESKTVTLNSGNNTVNFDAGDFSYPALLTTSSIASGVLFKSGSDDSTSELIANIDFNNITTDGSDFILEFSASGWFNINNPVS